jgi:hypothetical protein
MACLLILDMLENKRALKRSRIAASGIRDGLFMRAD